MDHPAPRKNQGSVGANLHATCAVAWDPCTFTDCLETPAFELPSAIALSQLPSGAPTSVTHHHPFSQRAPWGPSTDGGNPSTVTRVRYQG